MNRNVLTTGVALLATFSIIACGDGDRGTAEDMSLAERAGGIAVACTAALPESLDPFVSPDLSAADLRLLLYTPLVLFDSAGGIRPYLAREWEWHDGQTRLVFRLRTDVRWHDGRPVTAGDVAWTVRAAGDSSYTYSSWADMNAVRDVVARDSATVEVTFDEPFVAGLEPFVQLPILPQHLVGQVRAAEFARAPYHREPVGSGPFRFAGRTTDGSLQFDRFPEFSEDLGAAFLDRLVLRAVPEPSAMMVELQTGGLDACVTGSSMAKQIGAAPELSAQGLAPVGVQVIQLSTAQAPFRDVRVRRAVSAALDRVQIAASISALARPARTFLPAASERWLDPTALQPDADSALAAALLDSAGWRTIGADGIRRNATGAPLRFTLAAPQPFENPLTVVQAQLRRLGVDARLEFMEGASYIGRIMNPSARPQAFALSLFPEKVSLPDPTGQLHSKGGSNLTGYANANVDSLIDRLSMVIPDEERRTIYHALQRRVAEDVHMVYTVYSSRVLALGPRLEGVRTDLNGPFASVGQWWIPPTKRRAGP